LILYSLLFSFFLLFFIIFFCIFPLLHLLRCRFCSSFICCFNWCLFEPFLAGQPSACVILVPLALLPWALSSSLSLSRAAFTPQLHCSAYRSLCGLGVGRSAGLELAGCAGAAAWGAACWTIATKSTLRVIASCAADSRSPLRTKAAIARNDSRLMVELCAKLAARVSFAATSGEALRKAWSCLCIGSEVGSPPEICRFSQHTLQGHVKRRVQHLSHGHADSWSFPRSIAAFHFGYAYTLAPEHILHIPVTSSMSTRLITVALPASAQSRI
jgi:hypothetical protein